MTRPRRLRRRHPSPLSYLRRAAGRARLAVIRADSGGGKEGKEGGRPRGGGGRSQQAEADEEAGEEGHVSVFLADVALIAATAAVNVTARCEIGESLGKMPSGAQPKSFPITCTLPFGGQLGSSSCSFLLLHSHPYVMT